VYYSIGEVARMFNVNQSLLRYWEKQFDVIKPVKNKKGNRLYTQDDIRHLQIIYNLVKERGFTIQGAKEKLRINKHETADTSEIIQSLNKIRTFLTDLKDGL